MIFILENIKINFTFLKFREIQSYLKKEMNERLLHAKHFYNETTAIK